MRSPRYSFGLLAMIAASAIASFGAAVERASAAIDRFVEFIVAAIAPAAPRMAFDGPVAARSIDRASLDPALLSGLRHESRVSRRSADRNI